MRNRTMFGGPGLAYVYLSYGIHHLLNAVCERERVGSAVLIRALRPLEGQALMVRRRGRRTSLCNGPGKLTQALGVDLAKDGHDLTGGVLTISRGEPPECEIVATTRVGITRGVELPWRYLISGDANVSVAPKRLEG
jgi:DNA-3-methyladenine glycosylase